MMLRRDAEMKQRILEAKQKYDIYTTVLPRLIYLKFLMLSGHKLPIYLKFLLFPCFSQGIEGAQGAEFYFWSEH